METWLRDLKARFDGESLRHQQQLQDQFEKDAADTLAELAEASRQQKEDAIRHLLLDVKVRHLSRPPPAATRSAGRGHTGTPA